MRNTCLFAFACVTLIACNDDKGDEKKKMDAILAAHEKVMGAEDKAMQNKMQIDSLLKLNKFNPADSAEQKAVFRKQSIQLSTADDAMTDWMHKFDPGYKGKSHGDMMSYLTSQQKQIIKIDSQLNAAITQSGAALTKYKHK